MSVPLMLGGIPIVLHAGAPELSEQPIGGWSRDRMSDGALIKQTHWEKAGGTISASGWIPPGLDGLDYTGTLELRSTQVSNMQSAGLVFTLPTTPRTDQSPWGLALVGDQWVSADVSTVYGVATVTAVAGATLYQVLWLPVYTVSADRPTKTQSSGIQSWSISWEQV
jgi:hypothetical protein